MENVDCILVGKQGSPSWENTYREQRNSLLARCSYRMSSFGSEDTLTSYRHVMKSVTHRESETFRLLMSLL